MCSSRCTLALILVFSSLLSCQDKGVQPPSDGGLGDSGSLADSGPLDGGACHTGGCDCSVRPCADGFICSADHACEKAPACRASDEECEFDEDCCQGSDATKGAWCNEEGKCAECSVKDAVCQSDYDCCPSMTPLTCTHGKICKPLCNLDSDCEASEVCMPSGECYPTPCSSDIECPGQKCCSGACKEDCGYGIPNACAITTPGGVIFPDRKFKLHAVAWAGEAKEGAQIIPWTQFSWSSSNSPAVTVDPTSGELTAGREQGGADISARVGLLDCGSVTVTNHLPALPDAVRVIVYDRETGKPVDGADVIIGSNAPMRTDAAGMVSIAGQPADVHIFHERYTWVSLVGLGLNDYVVHLTPKQDETNAGGFRGTFDFSDEPRGYRFGRACTSFSGEIWDAPLRAVGSWFFFDVGPDMRCDDLILTHIRLRTSDGALTDMDEWLPTAGGFMADEEQIGSRNLIPSYRVLGKKGLRVSWAIAGGLPHGDINKLYRGLTYHPDPIVSMRSDPGAGIYGLATLWLLQNLGHALASVFEVVPIPKVPTPDAENGEPLIQSPTIADYEHFSELDLKPSNRLTLKIAITPPLLPRLQGRCMSGLYIEGESVIPGMGVVTLGKNGGFDNPDDPNVPGDCVIEKPYDNNPEGLIKGQMVLRMSPNHDGIENNPYRIVLLASEFNRSIAEGVENSFGFPFNATIGGETAAVSGRILQADVVGKTLDMTSQEFLGFPEAAVFDSAARTISAPPAGVAGASMFSYTISNPNGDWRVFTDINTSQIFLPVPPPGHEDRSIGSGMKIAALGTRGVLLGELVSSTIGVHLNDLGDLVDAFSRLTCLKKVPTDDPDYATKCQPANPTQVDEACNPACEVR